MKIELASQETLANRRRAGIDKPDLGYCGLDTALFGNCGLDTGHFIIAFVKSSRKMHANAHVAL